MNINSYVIPKDSFEIAGDVLYVPHMWLMENIEHILKKNGVCPEWEKLNALVGAFFGALTGIVYNLSPSLPFTAVIGASWAISCYVIPCALALLGYGCYKLSSSFAQRREIYVKDDKMLAPFLNNTTPTEEEKIELLNYWTGRFKEIEKAVVEAKAICDACSIQLEDSPNQERVRKLANTQLLKLKALCDDVKLIKFILKRLS